MTGGSALWIKQYDFVILIKEVRVQLDLSQEDFAREIGVSVETYCDRMIELGRLLLPDDL
jgi:DNA-binding XRE family transcriptional regulator